MATVQSAVVEITWRPNNPFPSNACEIIDKFLKTPQAESVRYRKPEERLTGGIKFDYHDKCHHVFVQIKLKTGNFGNYISSLRASAQVHENVATVAWRDCRKLVRGNVARIGRICLDGKQLTPGAELA